MPKEILELTKLYQHEPEIIKVVRKELTVPNIKQFYIETRRANKLEVLCRLNGTYKTLAKQILSEASYILNDNCSDGVGPTINEQLKRYQEVLNAAIDEKINQINKL